MDIDEALWLAGGEWGWFQRKLYILVLIAGIPNAFTFMHFSYSNFAPPHHCKYPDELTSYQANSTEEYQMLVDYVIPKEEAADGKLVSSQCKIYDRNYSAVPMKDWQYRINDSTSIIDCPSGWSFDAEPGLKTAAMELSMICHDDWMPPLIVTIFMAGVAACSLSGALSDKFGRRPVFLAACFVQTATTALTVLAHDFTTYAILEFLNGLSSLLNYVVAFVIATEMTHASVRNFMAVSSFVAYAFGYCVVAGMSFMFQNWRMNLGMMALVSGVIYLPNIWLMPESVRWLTQKGKTDEAMSLLKKIAKTNGNLERLQSKFKENHVELTSKSDVESSGIAKTLQVIFKSGIGKRCCTVMLCWFTTSLVYFAVSFYSTDFSSDRYLNVLYAGLAEFPAFFLVYQTLNYVGRPRTIFILLSICGCSSIILAFLPEDSTIVKTATSMIGKGAVSAGFYVDYIMAAEVVPTLERGSFLSICSFIARVGAFISPFLMYLAKISLFIPNMTMGAMAITCAVAAVIWIPETNYLPMPDTLAEAKQNRRFYRLRVFRNFTTSAAENVIRKEGKDENATFLKA